MIVAAINCIPSRKKIRRIEPSWRGELRFSFLRQTSSVNIGDSSRGSKKRRISATFAGGVDDGHDSVNNNSIEDDEIPIPLIFDSRRWRKTSDSLSWLRSWLAKSFPQYLLSLVGSAAAFHLTNQLSTTDCFYKDWLVPHSSSFLHKSSDSVTLDSIF